MYYPKGNQSNRLTQISEIKMSSRIPSKSSVSNNAKSCTFCKENHVLFEMVRGKKVIKCPTLLNAVCPYCKDTGHTMKNCELKQRDDAQLAKGHKEQERERKRQSFEAKQEEKKSVPKKINSKFAAFEESSSSDEEVEVAQPPKKESKKSYSEMAAAKVEVPIEAPPPPEPKAVITTNDIPKKKSILERLREPMPAPVSACILADDAKLAAKALIRQKRKEVVMKYKAEGKPVPWAILDEYNTDSDSDSD